MRYSVRSGGIRWAVLGALICFSGAKGAALRDRANPSLPPGGVVVRLPVIDKNDLRFVQVTAEGEPFQSRVGSIAQDRAGFLWFGTSDGLYRYDGYKLKPYRHEPGNPNSLSDDTIMAIYRDRGGILWVGTGFGGLDRLDPVSDTFIHYRHDPANGTSLSHNAVQYIYQDRGGSTWVATSGGL